MSLAVHASGAFTIRVCDSVDFEPVDHFVDDHGLNVRDVCVHQSFME